MRKSILEGLRSELLTRTPLSALPEPVMRRMCAWDTWGSNAIEGNVLTLSEVEALVEEGRTPGDRPVGDVLETVQHVAALRRLFAWLEAPVRATTAQDLHAAVFRGVLQDAGQLRRHPVSILGSRHHLPGPERVGAMLAEWEVEYSERDRAGEDPLRLGAWMHHRFEAIHPFSDGNGRVGRLLLALHLLKHSWPPVHVTPGERDAYIDAMEEGHLGRLGPLEGLLGVLMGRSLLQLLAEVGTDEDELVSVSKLEGPYSAKYLALRASQGELPAVKRRGRWLTSRRTLGLYREAAGRR